MPRITIPIPETYEETTLTADAVKTATALTVKNNNKFAQNDYVVVGENGIEDSELRKIASITGSVTITTDALVFDHPNNTPIRQIKYNQAKIYRSSTEAGSYALIATIDLEVDVPKGTIYDDTAGSATSWYKYTYYNSTTAAASDYSSAVLATGFTPKSRKAMIDDVLMLVNDKEAKYITRDEVGDKINQQQSIWWLSPYTKRDTLTTDDIVTDDEVNYIELDENFDKLKDDYAVRFNHVVGTTTDEWYCLKIISKSEWYERFGDNLADTSDDLEYCAIEDTTFPKRLLLGPTPTTADLDIKVEYYKKPADLTAESDETICPIPRILTLPVAAEICLVKGEFDKHDRLMNMANSLTVGEIAHIGTKGGSFKMQYKKQRNSGRFKGGSVSDD